MACSNDIFAENVQACGNARLFNFCVWRSLYINQAFLQANECRAQPKIAHICSIFSGFHLDSCVSLIIANKCLLKMHCLTKTKVPNQNSIEMSPLYNIVQALQTKFNPENIKSDLEWTKSWRINETLVYFRDLVKVGAYGPADFWWQAGPSLLWV